MEKLGARKYFDEREFYLNKPLSRAGKLFLGIATLAILASTIYIDISFYSFLGRISLIDASGLKLYMALFIVNSMLNFGLMAFYFVHILLRRDMNRAEKWAWAIFVVMLNLLVMTVFYLFRILPRTKNDTSSPGLNSA